jgi:hypothetical protein
LNANGAFTWKGTPDSAAEVAAVKSCRSFLAIGCFPLLACCSIGQQAHRELYVCAGNAGEGAFFDYIAEAAKELGYRLSKGTSEDAHRHVTTVVKATGWSTDIWATNQIIVPALNDPAGEIIPRHDAFNISVNGQPFAAKQVDRTYFSLRSKLSRGGYRISDQPCPADA